MGTFTFLCSSLLFSVFLMKCIFSWAGFFTLLSVSFHLDNLIFLEMVRMLWIRMCVLPFWLQDTFKVCSNSVSVNMKQIQASPIIHNESFRTLFFFWGVCQASGSQISIPQTQTGKKRWADLADELEGRQGG